MNDEQRWADERTVDAMSVEPATMREIARRLGVSPSIRLQRRLNRLTEEGRIGRDRSAGFRYMIGGHG